MHYVSVPKSIVRQNSVCGCGGGGVGVQTAVTFTDPYN